MNIQIGIKETPVKGKLPDVELFYIGRDGVELRKKHETLLKANKNGSKFFVIQNPLLTPLQHTVTNTEDHPEELAARKHREELADALTKNQIKSEKKSTTDTK